MTEGIGARPIAPTLLWAVVAVLAFIGSLMLDGAAVAIAAGGAVVALTMLEAPLATRILTVAALVPAALVGDGPAWGWAAAACALGLGTSLYPRQPAAQADVNGDLQRHLAWCRRREEPAHLLVVPLGGVEEAEVASVIESFRITDSVTLGRSSGSELYALLDAHGFVREGLERRLAERLDGNHVGWASFPQDGVTLQTLIEHARTAMQGMPAAANGRAQITEDGALVEGASHARTALEHATGRS